MGDYTAELNIRSWKKDKFTQDKRGFALGKNFKKTLAGEMPTTYNKGCENDCVMLKMRF